MLDWKPLCIRRKRHFKSSLISSGTLSRRSKTQNLMNSFWPTRSALLMLKSLERFWIFVQELKVKNSLRYKIMMLPSGPLHKYTNMYVDHMHQPWRTLVAIINKCLSGNTASNDKLRKSRINILWGMFYRENVDYPELIWKDFAFQIDHRKERKSRRKTMPFFRFTKVIINHFLLQHKSLTNLKFQHNHTIKDDGIVSRLKFFKIGEDYQEFGLPIPDMMMNDAIKQSESYQIFHWSNCSQEEQRQRLTRKEPSTGGSSEGTCRIPGVPNESTIVSATSSEGTGTKPGFLDEEKVTSEANVILEWVSKQESKYSEEDQHDDEEVDWIYSDEDEEKKDDDKSIYLEMTDDEETKDEFVHEISDAAKPDVEKTKEVKDDAKKTELPLTSSSLYVSSGFGDQFLKLLSDTSLISTVKDTTDVEINSLLDIRIQSEVPHIPSLFILIVPISVISEPLVLIPLQETPLVAPVTSLRPPSVSTIPNILLETTAPIPTPPITTETPTITTTILESDALIAVQLRVEKLEKDVFELKKIDHSAEALTAFKLQVPTRHTADLIQKYSVNPSPESSKIQTPKINPARESKKSASEIHKIKKEQAEKKKFPKYTIKSN
ncbi:hypothetical protein Tco_1061264 [Tanacetum coccineum]